MINFEITKEDVLNKLCEKVLEACEDIGAVNDDGEYFGGKNKYLPLLNLFLNHVSDKVVKDLIEKQKLRLEVKINDKIDAELNKILYTSFQPVNNWGEKNGDVTTVKEIFEKRSRDFWLQTVDENGKKSDGWGVKMTRAEFIAKQHIEESFKTALSKDIDPIIKGLKAALHSSLTEVSKIEIEKAISKLVKPN